MSQVTPDCYIERHWLDEPGPYEQDDYDEPWRCRHGHIANDCFACSVEYKARYQLENQETTESTADEWEQISSQLDYWADMDREYWRQRREKAYTDYLNRKLQTTNNRNQNKS